jgi:hypothetical protein
MNFVRCLTAMTLLFSAPITWAEYRAYQYVVQSRFEQEQGRSYIVTSSLDPVSYVAYHGGADSITVNLLRSWMCPGNTGNWETCPAPGDELENRLPASTPEL